jgi:oligosaccharide repeat unit polymerase
MSGYGGVFLGKYSREYLFNLELPYGMNRLPSAFIVLSILICSNMLANKTNPLTYIIFILTSFFILTINGSRWIFFQLIVSTFFFVILSGEWQKLLKFKKIFFFTAVLFIVFQPLISELRTSDIDSDEGRYIGILGSLLAWGGEYRDAASSVARLDASQIKVISEYYLSGLFYPLIPDFVADLFSLDKKNKISLTAAHFMMVEYGIQDGTIRIGGILESYYWFDYWGVIISALIYSLLVIIMDRYRYVSNKNILCLIVLSALGSSLIYFPVSQATTIFPPLAAIYSILLLLLIQKYVSNSKN